VIKSDAVNISTRRWIGQ